MQVERSQLRSGPNDFGQHAERDDDAQIGPHRAECFDESRVPKLLRLVDGQSRLQCVPLDRALLYVQSPARRLVGHRDDAYDVIPLLDELGERGYREVGRSHVYDAQFFCFHAFQIVISTRFPSGSATTLS